MAVVVVVVVVAVAVALVVWFLFNVLRGSCNSDGDCVEPNLGDEIDLWFHVCH